MCHFCDPQHRSFLEALEDHEGQAEDSRYSGRALGNTTLAEIGEVGERHHDEYNREANRLVQQMFVEHVRDVEPGVVEDSLRSDI